MINDVVILTGLPMHRTGFETFTDGESTDVRPGMAIVAVNVRPFPDPR